MIKVKQMIYIAVLCNPKITTEPLYNTPCSLDPMLLPTIRHFWHKCPHKVPNYTAFEQRHIRCEQLAQGCCPNYAAVGVEPATSRSRVQRSNHYTTEPPNNQDSALSSKHLYKMDQRTYIYSCIIIWQPFNTFNLNARLNSPRVASIKHLC